MNIPVGYRRWILPSHRHEQRRDTPGHYFYQRGRSNELYVLQMDGTMRLAINTANSLLRQDRNWSPDWPDNVILPEGI